MKNILNKIFFSKRGKGKIINNKVEDYELITYDFVSHPIDFSDTNEFLLRIQEMLKKEQLREDRKKKLNKINVQS